MYTNWFPNHDESVYLTLMYLLHYNICKKPKLHQQSINKKRPQKSQNCMKARYKALVVVDCCSLSEPHCIELQNAAVTEQSESVWAFGGKNERICTD